MDKIPLFPLGQVVATPGTLAAFEEAGEDSATYLARHNAGDWGDLGDHDIAENESSLNRHLRLLPAYTLSDGETRLWIITEADRSATTLLLPSEY